MPHSPKGPSPDFEKLFRKLAKIAHQERLQRDSERRAREVEMLGADAPDVEERWPGTRPVGGVFTPTKGLRWTRPKGVR